MIHLTTPELARFNSKYQVVGDCHLWNGPLDRDGYGTFFLRGASRRAHRVAYFGLHGGIPDGMVVNHICRNRNCVNPQHLSALSPKENALRDSASLGYINSQKTHCKNGHPYDRTETWSGKVQRICSICDRERRAAAAKERRRAGKASLKV